MDYVDYKYHVVGIDPPTIRKDYFNYIKQDDIWYLIKSDESLWFDLPKYKKIENLIELLNNAKDLADHVYLRSIRETSGLYDYGFEFGIILYYKVEDIDVVNRLEKELKYFIIKKENKDLKEREKLYKKLKKEFEK